MVSPVGFIHTNSRLYNFGEGHVLTPLRIDLTYSLIKSYDLFNSTNISADILNTEDTLRGYTQKIIKFYLEKYHDDVAMVAQKLNMGKSTIYRMLKNEEL